MDRRFSAVEPLSLVLYKGQLGFWSRDAARERCFVWLDPRQATLLLQFASRAQFPAEAAAGAGLPYNSDVAALIQEFVRYQILQEHIDDCEEPFYRFYHPEADEDEPICIFEPQALDEYAVGQILEGLRHSELVGHNILSDGFASTHGFGVKFRREALDRLAGWMPWTRPYLDKVIDSSIAKRLRLPSAEEATPNAFYFNALVIPPGKGTALHVDRTLDNRTPARWVSVLYLTVTPPPGGRLFLYDGGWPVAMINPRPGMIVHFRGDLKHGVADTQPLQGERVSLVCEHYSLPETSLKGCPYFEIVTAARPDPSRGG